MATNIVRFTIDIDEATLEPDDWTIRTFAHDRVNQEGLAGFNDAPMLEYIVPPNEVIHNDLKELDKAGMVVGVQYIEGSGYTTSCLLSHGLMYWSGDLGDFGNDNNEAIRKRAYSFLAEYNHWLHGRVYQITVERLITGSPDDPTAKWRKLRTLPSIIGDDELNFAVVNLKEDYIHRDIIFTGDAVGEVDEMLR